jgi:hypothetical protein
MNDSRRSFWISVAAALFPCLLLLPFKATYAVDWINIQWIAAYVGEFFARHGSLPAILNTPENIGMPYPVFYGPLFFKMTGFLSAFISSGVVFRLVIFALFFIQLRLVRRVLLGRGVSEPLAIGTACLVTWAIYPLTNLYSRGALTEFFAAASLTLALCYLFELFSAKDRREKILKAFQLGFCAMLFVGTHPITALYGITFLIVAFAFLFLETGWKESRQNLAFLFIPGFLAVIVIAPWVYSILQISKDTLLTSTWGGVMDYGKTIDWAVSRFFPVPFDVRMLHNGPSAVSTPYLEAQVNVPLLILAIAATVNSWKRPIRWPVFGSWVLFLILSWMSVNHRLLNLLPKPYLMIQFAYRMVTYINLATFAAFVFALNPKRNPSRDLSAALISFCVALSFAGVWVKSVHGITNRNMGGPSGLFLSEKARKELVHMPHYFYGDWAYATPALSKMLTPDELTHSQEHPFEVGDQADFGVVRPLVLDQKSPSWIRTQVQIFPWNEIRVDGKMVPIQELRVWSRFNQGKPYHGYYYTAVWVPQGRHSVTYQFAPDSIWTEMSIFEGLRKNHEHSKA